MAIDQDKLNGTPRFDTEGVAAAALRMLPSHTGSRGDLDISAIPPGLYSKCGPRISTRGGDNHDQADYRPAP